MRAPRRARPMLGVLEDRQLLAITIQIDYTYDTSHFFNTALKRNILQQAATILSGYLTDNLAAIVPYGTNTWQASFLNPSTGAPQTLTNPVVPANTIILYVGARNLSGGGEAGVGATSGFSASGDQAWLNLLKGRGKIGALASPPTAFSEWGASVAFDNSGSNSWFFGYTTAGLAPNQTDFLTVAEHEIAHALGFGTSNVFASLVSGGKFNGTNARAFHGGSAVSVDPTGAHWASGTTSNGNPVVMQPVLPKGTRLLFTPLDYAGLKDIGWQIAIPGTAGTNVPSDFTHAGVSQQAVFRSTTAQWFVRGQTGLQLIVNPNNVYSAFGLANYGDIPVPGDYDGIGWTELAVFRPSTAQWFVLSPTGTHQIVNPNSPNGSFGIPGDIPVPGDYDGVGHTQLAVFRPSTAQWFVLGPTGGHQIVNTNVQGGGFGATNLFDIPVPGDYDGLGRTQPAVFRPSTAQWFALGPTGGHQIVNSHAPNGAFGLPNLFDIPVPGDYLGQGKTQLAVFRPATGEYFVLGPSGGVKLALVGSPNLIDLPTQAPAGALLQLHRIGPTPSAASALGLATPSGLSAAANTMPVTPSTSTTAAGTTSSTAFVRPMSEGSTIRPRVVVHQSRSSPEPTDALSAFRLDAELPGSLIVSEKRLIPVGDL